MLGLFIRRPAKRNPAGLLAGSAGGEMSFRRISKNITNIAFREILTVERGNVSPKCGEYIFSKTPVTTGWISGRCEKSPAGPRPAQRVRKVLARLAVFWTLRKRNPAGLLAGSAGGEMSC